MTPADIPNLRNRDILWQMHTSAAAFLIMLRVSTEVNKPLYEVLNDTSKHTKSTPTNDPA